MNTRRKQLEADVSTPVLSTVREEPELQPRKPRWRILRCLAGGAAAGSTVACLGVAGDLASVIGALAELGNLMVTVLQAV